MKLGGGPGGSGGTNFIVRFYLHGGTFVLLLVLNFLRPDHRRVVETVTDVWDDLIATVMLNLWYIMVLYMHYKRFHMFVYPPLMKLHKIWHKMVLMVAICLILFFCTQVIKYV